MKTTLRTPDRRTALNVAGVVLLVAVVLPFAVFTIPQVAGADHGYVVVSSSMSPAISTGDAVIVNDVPANTVEEGDVITFIDGKQATIQQGKAGGNLITHRVVDIQSTDQRLAFKTKGDANEEADRGSVPASALVGRVMFTIPYIGHVIAFAGTQLGLIMLVALPLGLLVGGEVYDLAVAARNTRQQAENTTETQPNPDAGESSVKNNAVPKTNTNQAMTESISPAGFDPGVSVAGNGAPTDVRDPRTESIDSTTDDENGGIDDA